MNGVSVIICCYNSAKRLHPTLSALKKQIFSGAGISWELVIVDNTSDDGTMEVAREIREKDPVVAAKFVLEPNTGLMNARMKGLEHAEYDIVSFIDDDNWVEER